MNPERFARPGIPCWFCVAIACFLPAAALAAQAPRPLPRRVASFELCRVALPKSAAAPVLARWAKEHGDAFEAYAGENSISAWLSFLAFAPDIAVFHTLANADFVAIGCYTDRRRRDDALRSLASSPAAWALRARPFRYDRAGEELYIVGLPPAAAALLLVSLRGRAFFDLEGSLTPESLFSAFSLAPEPALVPTASLRRARAEHLFASAFAERDASGESLPLLVPWPVAGERPSQSSDLVSAVREVVPEFTAPTSVAFAADTTLSIAVRAPGDGPIQIEALLPEGVTVRRTGPGQAELRFESWGLADERQAHVTLLAWQGPTREHSLCAVHELTLVALDPPLWRAVLASPLRPAAAGLALVLCAVAVAVVRNRARRRVGR